MATQEAVMTTRDVANRLQELFKENKWMEAQQELFSDDAESVEPKDSPGMQSVKGIDAIRKKGEDFNNMVEEVHGGWVSEPIVAGKYIAVAMGIEKPIKKRSSEPRWGRNEDSGKIKDGCSQLCMKDNH